MIQIFNGRTRALGQDAQHAAYLQVSVQMRQHLHHFKGAPLGVFLAIALHSNADGWAWPSIAGPGGVSRRARVAGRCAALAPA